MKMRWDVIYWRRRGLWLCARIVVVSLASGWGWRKGGERGSHLSSGLSACTEMVRTALAANPGVIDARTPAPSAPRLATVAMAATCRYGGEEEKRTRC
jgi:hypothetical protein